MTTGLVEPVVIERLAHGGEGVGRLPDGRVCFVMLAAPGDRVRVRVTESHPRWARGELAAVLEPGPSRTAPGCPLFGRCGGCQWQHVTLEAQRAAKQATVAHALGAEVLPIETPGPALGYRRRARLHLEMGRVGYRALRSHEVVDVPSCPLLLPPLEAALLRLRAALSGRTGEAQLLVGQGGELAAAAPGPAVGAARIDLGDGAGRPFWARADTFVQANAYANASLRARVRGALAGAARVLELFAGSGNFTRDLLAAGADVVALEASRDAAELARENLAGLPGRLRLVTAPVERALSSESGRFDAILVDPPRTGLDARLPAQLTRLSGHLVYVSCDPVTLGRDVSRLRALGWTLDRAAPVDAWPQTFHVETVAELSRHP